MATTNVAMIGSWTKIADASDDFCVSFMLNDAVEGALPKGYITIEIALVATDTAPSVRGRILVIGGPDKRNEGATRSILGDGYLYGRLIGSSYPILAIVDIAA
jgi:hypothetical protein